MNTLQHHVISIGLILAAFAIGSSSIVVITEKATRQKIIDNERQTLLKAINILIPKQYYNNDILADTLEIPAEQKLATSKSSTVYRARLDGNPIAAVFTSIAPDGYSGKIKLLIGVYNNGDLAGVRVIQHKETPGLGDKIEPRKSDWINRFSGLSLNDPVSSQWQVKKDGGYFDQFTGATITPRAVVRAVKNALLYFKVHQETLFKPQFEKVL
jgi:electron transport complex protein RnfG